MNDRRSGSDRRALVNRRLSWFERAPIWILAVLTVVVCTFLAGTAVVVVLNAQRSVTRAIDEIQAQASETRDVVIQNREILTALVCEVSRTQTVSLAGVRALARRFGVTIPKLPGEAAGVTRCALPGDDVFIGTSRADRIRGTPERDFISGEGGRDRLFGKRGSDAIIGGDGRDVVRAGVGSDRLFGNDSRDVLYARANDHDRDVLNGGRGFDVCYLRRNDRAIECDQIIRA